MKTFPIIATLPERRKFGERLRTSIPWDMIEPHERQALTNHQQTLERLAERGGLDPCEAVAVLEDRRWSLLGGAWERLEELVKAWEPG